MLVHNNTTEESFLNWLDNCSDTLNTADSERFYIFVKTKIENAVKKWNDYNYFKQRILEVKNNFLEQNIKYYYNELQKLTKFYFINKLEDITSTTENKFIKRDVVNNKIVDIEISREEFLKSGLKRFTENK